MWMQFQVWVRVFVSAEGFNEIRFELQHFLISNQEQNCSCI